MGVGDAARHALERMLGRYYEGPEPPARLRDEVRIWVATHPDATIGDAAEFAVRFSEVAYREGFQRGYEWEQRGMVPGDLDDPRVVDDARQHSISMVELHERARVMIEQGHDPNDPLAGVAMPARYEFFRAMDQAQTAEVRWRNEPEGE